MQKLGVQGLTKEFFGFEILPDRFKCLIAFPSGQTALQKGRTLAHVHMYYAIVLEYQVQGQQVLDVNLKLFTKLTTLIWKLSIVIIFSWSR